MQTSKYEDTAIFVVKELIPLLGYGRGHIIVKGKEPVNLIGLKLAEGKGLVVLWDDDICYA